MPPGGIRTYNLSRRAAADLRLRPRGRWGANRNTSTIALLSDPTNPTYNGPGLNQSLLGERLETNCLNHGRNSDLSTLQIEDPVATSHKTYCASII